MRAVKILKYVFVGEKSIGKEREWKRKKGKREREVEGKGMEEKER